MPHRLLLLLLLAFATPLTAALAPATPTQEVVTADWREYERATVEERLGRKLKFKERIALSVMRGKLKRQQKRAVRNRRGAPIDGFAVASLVCGILAPFTLILAIPAIVFGFVALGRFKRDPQYRTGKGMAIAGLILGFTTVFLVLLVLAIISSLRFA